MKCPVLTSKQATYELESLASQPIGAELNDGGKLERIGQLEELLEAHRNQLVESNRNVDLYRGLVERYGGNTSEVLAREEIIIDEEVVGRSLKETLKKNEALNDRASFNQ